MWTVSSSFQQVVVGVDLAELRQHDGVISVKILTSGRASPKPRERLGDDSGSPSGGVANSSRSENYTGSVRPRV